MVRVQKYFFHGLSCPHSSRRCWNKGDNETLRNFIQEEGRIGPNQSQGQWNHKWRICCTPHCNTDVPEADKLWRLNSASMCNGCQGCKGGQEDDCTWWTLKCASTVGSIFVTLIDMNLISYLQFTVVERVISVLCIGSEHLPAQSSTVQASFQSIYNETCLWQHGISSWKNRNYDRKCCKGCSWACNHHRSSMGWMHTICKCAWAERYHCSCTKYRRLQLGVAEHHSPVSKALPRDCCCCCNINLPTDGGGME